MSETPKNCGSTTQGDHIADLPLQTAILPYGTQRISFSFDPEQFTVLAPRNLDAKRLTDAELDARLDAPIGTLPLEEIVKDHERVVIVAPDATRAAGIDRMAPVLVNRLSRLGVPDANISVLIGGGTHRAPTDAEIKSILGPDLPRRIAIYSHDANDPKAHAWLGKTSRGTEVHLNRRLSDSDHVIALGAISYHYIAGFSGGPKAILPGCGAKSSIQSTHLLSFDCEKLEARSSIGSGRLDGNPVQEDMIEAVQFLNPSFLINTVLGSDGEIIGLYAGHWMKAHRQGCHDYASAHRVNVIEQRPLVIASAGGAPRDINLIQSHKAIEHAADVLEEGGTMIALASCPDGLGLENFLRWFVPGDSRETAKMLIEDYQIYGQTAWSLRRKAERFRILLVSTLKPDTVRAMGLEPHGSLEAALAATPKQSGYIVTSGLTTLATLRET